MSLYFRKFSHYFVFPFSLILLIYNLLIFTSFGLKQSVSYKSDLKITLSGQAQEIDKLFYD